MIVNSTHYWHDTSRVFVETPDITSFGYESNRRMSFYLRLYYEYLYCQSVKGQCFYVTFTYNNNAIPLLFGQPVFNYEHIRLISNGKISKILSRQYGSKLKYLCACESGDGKGKRGKGNNPHYHFIFYVIPSSSDYKPISPVEFLDLCKEVWQGKRGFCRWQFARFGSVKEGKFGVVVNSTNALKYVSKYCLKDSLQIDSESKISQSYYKECCDNKFSVYNFKRYYYYLKSFDKNLSVRSFLALFDAETFFLLRRRDHISLDYFFNKYSLDFIDTNDSHFFPFVRSNVIKFNKFFNEVILPDYVSCKMQSYKCLYSGKMRCSKSLGIYGLNFVLDSDSNPHFKIFESDSVRTYQLPLYYVRHLYYDVTFCSVTGNVLYVLNKKGHDLKLCRLSSVIGRFYDNTLKNVNTLLSNKLSFFYKYDSFNVSTYALNLKLSCDYLRTVYKYAVYSVVYKNRCFNPGTPLALSSSFSFNEVLEDFDMFLSNDRFKLDFEELSVLQIFSRVPSERLFSSHPLFKDYYLIFDFLDSVNDFIKTYKSDIKRSVYNATAEHLKLLNAYGNS